MCEIRYQKCTTCKTTWQAHRKLASCENQDPATRCPDNLCMYVGNQRKPIKTECETCRNARELIESLEDDSS